MREESDTERRRGAEKEEDWERERERERERLNERQRATEIDDQRDEERAALFDLISHPSLRPANPKHSSNQVPAGRRVSVQFQKSGHLINSRRESP